MSVVAVILTSIKIEKEVNLLKKGIQMNSLKNIEIAYYCDTNENQEVVNYLDTLITGCVKHVPNMLAVSIYEDMKYTFCENCESNIYSHYIEDSELLSYWSSWKVGK
jgi:hypothetical protein